MAAHDEKISNNRRRLFKALSATPVVVTLRPGTAAASSAYQCAEKIADTNLIPNLEYYGPVPAPTAGFVTETHDYFEIGELPQNCVPGFGSKTLVYIAPNLYDIDSPGVSITDGFTYIPSATEGDAGTLEISKNNGQRNCNSGSIPGKLGEFAVFYDVENHDLVGVAFPKADPMGDGLQGLTGTCMASIAGIPQQGLIS